MPPAHTAATVSGSRAAAPDARTETTWLGAYDRGRPRDGAEPTTRTLRTHHRPRPARPPPGRVRRAGPQPVKSGPARCNATSAACRPINATAPRIRPAARVALAPGTDSPWPQWHLWSHGHQKDSSNDSAWCLRAMKSDTTNRANRSGCAAVAGQSPEFWAPPAGFEPATPGLGGRADASPGASVSNVAHISALHSDREQHLLTGFHCTTHCTDAVSEVLTRLHLHACSRVGLRGRATSARTRPLTE